MDNKQHATNNRNETNPHKKLQPTFNEQHWTITKQQTTHDKQRTTHDRQQPTQQTSNILHQSARNTQETITNDQTTHSAQHATNDEPFTTVFDLQRGVVDQVCALSRVRQRATANY